MRRYRQFGSEISKIAVGRARLTPLSSIFIPKYYWFDPDRVAPSNLRSSSSYLCMIAVMSERADKQDYDPSFESEDCRQQTSQREAAYEIRFSERQDSPSRVFLRIVLRANRRKLPARAYHASLLLRSHLLRRSLRARGLNTHGTREGIMTTIQDTNRPVRAAVRPRQVCDHCGGSFGMVTHRWWGSKFCRRRCKEAYLREIRLDRDTVHRLCGLLGVTSRSRQACSSST